MSFGGLNIWRFDAWAGHTRTDDELKTAQRGPSPAVYLNRFGDPRVPSAVAVGLYVVCFVVASATLPTGHITQKKAMKRQDTTSVLTASRAVAATAGARLAVAFAMRAAMVTRQVYELERWDLSRSDYASFGLFKSITGIAASWGLAGPLSRRFCQGCGTEHLVKGAAAVAVFAALAEAVPWPSSTGVEGLAAKALADPSLLVYACVIFPLKTAAGQVATIALRARFTEVSPTSSRFRSTSSFLGPRRKRRARPLRCDSKHPHVF